MKQLPLTSSENININIQLHHAVCVFLALPFDSSQSLSQVLQNFFYKSDTSEMLELRRNVKSSLARRLSLLKEEQGLATNSKSDILKINEELKEDILKIFSTSILNIKNLIEKTMNFLEEKEKIIIREIEKEKSKNIEELNRRILEIEEESSYLKSQEEAFEFNMMTISLEFEMRDSQLRAITTNIEGLNRILLDIEKNNSDFESKKLELEDSMREISVNIEKKDRYLETLISKLKEQRDPYSIPLKRKKELEKNRTQKQSIVEEMKEGLLKKMSTHQEYFTKFKSNELHDITKSGMPELMEFLKKISPSDYSIIFPNLDFLPKIEKYNHNNLIIMNSNAVDFLNDFHSGEIPEISDDTSLINLLVGCLIENHNILYEQTITFMEFIAKKYPILFTHPAICNHFHEIDAQEFYGTSKYRSNLCDDNYLDYDNKGYNDILKQALDLIRKGILPEKQISNILKNDVSISSDTYKESDEMKLFKKVRKAFPRKHLSTICDNIRYRNELNVDDSLMQDKDFFEIRNLYHSSLDNGLKVEFEMHELWLESERLKFSSPPKNRPRLAKSPGGDTPSPPPYYASVRPSYLITYRDLPKNLIEEFFNLALDTVNTIIGNKPYILTVPLLRGVCARYIEKLDQKEQKNNWILQHFLSEAQKENNDLSIASKKAQDDYKNYKDNIRSSSGVPAIDSRILSEHFGIQIKIPDAPRLKDDTLPMDNGSEYPHKYSVRKRLQYNKEREREKSVDSPETKKKKIEEQDAWTKKILDPSFPSSLYSPGKKPADNMDLVVDVEKPKDVPQTKKSKAVPKLRFFRGKGELGLRGVIETDSTPDAIGSGTKETKKILKPK